MRRTITGKVRGIATIELILVTPILMLLMAGIAEFGWAFHQYKTLTRATRDGVRYAAAEANRSGVGIAIVDTTLAQATSNLVVYGNTAGTGTPLLPNWSVTDVTVAVVDSQHVRVDAQYRYVPLFAQLPFYGNIPSFDMHSSIVMRAL